MSDLSCVQYVCLAKPAPAESRVTFVTFEYQVNAILDIIHMTNILVVLGQPAFIISDTALYI